MISSLKQKEFIFSHSTCPLRTACSSIPGFFIVWSRLKEQPQSCPPGRRKGTWTIHEMILKAFPPTVPISLLSTFHWTKHIILPSLKSMEQEYILLSQRGSVSYLAPSNKLSFYKQGNRWLVTIMPSITFKSIDISIMGRSG